MEFVEFLDLDDRGKAFAVWHFGIYLMSRIDGEHNVKLYALSDFYVEVYHSFPFNMITEMRSFKRLDHLTPYLDQLELNELTTIG